MISENHIYIVPCHLHNFFKIRHIYVRVRKSKNRYLFNASQCIEEAAIIFYYFCNRFLEYIDEFVGHPYKFLLLSLLHYILIFIGIVFIPASVSFGTSVSKDNPIILYRTMDVQDSVFINTYILQVCFPLAIT